MHSGWWWGTDECAQYESAYWAGRVRPDVYKSSPLADDHVFDDPAYVQETHYSSVLDLTQPLETIWTGIRKSYHSIIHRAQELYCFNSAEASADIAYRFKSLHQDAFGTVRPDATFAMQEQWAREGSGLVVLAWQGYTEIDRVVAGAYWKLYQGCAYYGSGPSVERNVQHAVIWHSLELLKARGITKVEIGQVDGVTEKEVNVGKFKAGFGGTTVPYIVATRRN